MEQHLNQLLTKYQLPTPVSLEADRYVLTQSGHYPLFPYTAERRFMEMKGLITNGQVTGISVLRTLCVTEKGTDLWDVFYRQAGIAHYLLEDDMADIYATGDGKTVLNLIGKTAKGYVCSFELAATLPDGQSAIDKHEIIAQSGVVCDRVVDTQMPVSSVYLFSDNQTETFTDTDAELYGLDEYACSVVRDAFAVVKNGLDRKNEVSYLDILCEKAKESLKSDINVRGITYETR